MAGVVGLTPCTLVSGKSVFLPTFLPVNQVSSPHQPSSWPKEEMAVGAGTDLVRAQATLYRQRGALPPPSSGSSVSGTSRGLQSPWRAGSRGLHGSGLGQPAFLYPEAPSMSAYFSWSCRACLGGGSPADWMKQSMLTQTLAEPQCSLQPAVACVGIGKGTSVAPALHPVLGAGIVPRSDSRLPELLRKSLTRPALPAALCLPFARQGRAAGSAVFSLGSPSFS